MNVKKHFFNLMRSRDPLDGSPIDTIYTPDDTAFREAESADALLELDEHPNLIKVYPRDILCSKKSQRKCLIMSPEGPLFFGGRHLSVIGARLILEEIMFRLGMRRWL